MRVDWIGGVNSTWNYSLFLKFVQFMQGKVSDLPPKVPAPDRETMKEIFFNRLSRIREEVMKAQPQMVKGDHLETVAQVQMRLREADEAEKKKAKATTRRQTVRNITVSLLYTGLIHDRVDLRLAP